MLKGDFMRKGIIGWLIALCVMLLGIGGSSAQFGVRVVVVNEFLNIRVSPAIGASVIATVDAGYVFDLVDARSGDNQWVRVDYLCNEGWVNLAPTVVLEGDILSLPVADPRSIPFGGFESPRAGFTAQRGSVLGAATDGLRVRAGPNTAYPTLNNINFNETFSILGRNRCGSWVQVNYNGTLGWVSASFIRIIAGDHRNTPIGGIVADPNPVANPDDTEFIATVRLMVSRLDIAQESLNEIRTLWTDAALTGRAVCQAYPARPSDFPIPIPLLAANYDLLYLIQVDFNDAMANVRNAIDLYIQVCNQPGTANPVGQATIQGALNILNLTDDQFISLRPRLEALIPELGAVGAEECLLRFRNEAEIVPLVQFGAIYGDEFTRRTYARGYCFNGLELQVINFQALPIPPDDLKIFAAISPLDDPTNFVASTQGSRGQRVSMGPIILPRTTTYLLLLADLGGGEERLPYGDYAFLLTDLTFASTFPLIDYDTETGSVYLIEPIVSEPTPSLTQAVPVVCPSLNFTCSQLFSSAEAEACLQAGNFSLDQNNDGIACNEPGNTLLGSP
jgi:SH3 domain-containing protein